MGSSPDDAALVWRGNFPVRTRGNDKQASSVLTFGGPTRPKKPVRRCFKSRPSLRTRYAGFASGCRLGVSRTRTFSGGCPASCPDAHQPARNHGHVRNWAGPEIGAVAPGSQVFFEPLASIFLRMVFLCATNPSIQPLLSGTGRRREAVAPFRSLSLSPLFLPTKSNLASMMTLSRRIILQGLLASVPAPAWAQQQHTGVPTPNPFQFEDVVRRARELAGAPYEAAPSATSRAAEHAQLRRLPGHPLSPRHGPFSASRRQPVPDAAVPSRLSLPAPGDRERHPRRGPDPVPYQRELFNYGRNKIERPLPVNLGFAGFRLHYPINAPKVFDEVIAFLGASYFRFLGADQKYGLSARGLAINVEGGEAEEFPYFREFWVQMPTARHRPHHDLCPARQPLRGGRLPLRSLPSRRPPSRSRPRCSPARPLPIWASLLSPRCITRARTTESAPTISGLSCTIRTGC